MKVSPCAGKPAEASMLANVPRLVTSYYTETPDPSVPALASSLEVPVGFKWFVDGLLDDSLGFGGEERAGASFSRLDGTVWTMDKDGIVPALLAAAPDRPQRPGNEAVESWRNEGNPN